MNKTDQNQCTLVVLHQPLKFIEHKSIIMCFCFPTLTFCSGCSTDLDIQCSLVFSYRNLTYPVRPNLNFQRDPSLNPIAVINALQHHCILVPFLALTYSAVCSLYLSLFLLVELSEDRVHITYLFVFHLLYMQIMPRIGLGKEKKNSF